jgi:quercetin dioxygenase-like cupin family protein
MIQLTIPANVRIQAHTHPDDRVATVISGTWYIGYGAKFDEAKLKPLTAGSFYTEPPGVAHFARTGNEPVVLQITVMGQLELSMLRRSPPMQQQRKTTTHYSQM